MAEDLHILWNNRQLTSLLTNGISATPDELAQAMSGEGQIMLRNSTRLAPWLNRVLIGSATLLPPEIQGSKVTVKFGYGGSASKYALIQHDAEWAKKKRKPGRQWHYLLDAVNARVPMMSNSIYTRLQRILAAKKG
jgi:hypothetical protein